MMRNGRLDDVNTTSVDISPQCFNKESKKKWIRLFKHHFKWTKWMPFRTAFLKCFFSIEHVTGRLMNRSLLIWQVSNGLCSEDKVKCDYVGMCLTTYCCQVIKLPGSLREIICIPAIFPHVAEWHLSLWLSHPMMTKIDFFHLKWCILTDQCFHCPLHVLIGPSRDRKEYLEVSLSIVNTWGNQKVWVNSKCKKTTHILIILLHIWRMLVI